VNLTYVFGPVVATDTLINVNVQFNRVVDRRDRERGWGWTIEGDFDAEPMSELETSDHDAVEELIETLRTELYERIEEWREEQKERIRARAKKLTSKTSK
jgi:hypothetical protein